MAIENAAWSQGAPSAIDLRTSAQGTEPGLCGSLIYLSWSREAFEALRGGTGGFAVFGLPAACRLQPPAPLPPARLLSCWGPRLQAYLRLAKIPFAVQDCNAPSAAPTAQLPVLDAGADLVGGLGSTQILLSFPSLLMLLLVL